MAQSDAAHIRLGDLHPALEPHVHQREILLDGHRYKVVAAGRRFGKGTLGYQGATYQVLTCPRGSEIWIVSPTHVEQEAMWLKALGILGNARHDLLVSKHNPLGKLVKRVYSTRGYRKLLFYNDTILYFKSAKEPDSLRGAGDSLVYAIFDEAAYIDQDAWAVVVYSLIDRQAPCLFISTPNRHEPLNWFYQRWLWGQEFIRSTCPDCDGGGCDRCGKTGEVEIPNPDHRQDYKSWRFSSFDNPFNKPEEIQRIIETEGFTYADIQREIYANFIESEGAVFNLLTIQDCETGEFLPPQKGVRYVMGVDFGQVHDYTVAIVLNLDTGHVDWMDRFQGPWGVQFERIAHLYHKYNEPLVYVDATQVGGSMVEESLRKHGVVRLVGVKLAGPNKNRLIDGLRVAIDSGQITFPRHPQIRRELLAYTAQRLPSGHLRYSAASNEFDDIVVALALAWEAARSQRRVVDWKLRPVLLGAEEA